MKNWILNFIADERGTAAMEYGMAAVIMGGGAASGLALLKLLQYPLHLRQIRQLFQAWRRHLSRNPPSSLFVNH